MSTKALRQVVYQYWDSHREDGFTLADEARKELEAIQKAAKGLNQLDPRTGWNQQAWDDGLDLMESIAKEAP